MRHPRLGRHSSRLRRFTVMMASVCALVDVPEPGKDVVFLCLARNSPPSHLECNKSAPGKSLKYHYTQVSLVSLFWVPENRKGGGRSHTRNALLGSLFFCCFTDLHLGSVPHCVPARRRDYALFGQPRFSRSIAPRSPLCQRDRVLQCVSRPCREA